MHDENGTHCDTGSNESSRKEIDRLRAQLDMRLHDLRQAQSELARAREIQESLEEQLRAGAGVEASKTPANAQSKRREAPWPVNLWRRMTVPASTRAMLQDMQLLRDSEWFDPEWYLAEYPDVAQAGIDPIEHYLRSGAFEGRDPGPSFSTSAYLQDHPDLAGHAINPLVHFLRSAHGLRA